jgi:hypothetical protein
MPRSELDLLNSQHTEIASRVYCEISRFLRVSTEFRKEASKVLGLP